MWARSIAQGSIKLTCYLDQKMTDFRVIVIL